MVTCARCRGPILSYYDDTACLHCGWEPGAPVHPKARPEPAHKSYNTGHTFTANAAQRRFIAGAVTPRKAEWVEVGNV